MSALCLKAAFTTLFDRPHPLDLSRQIPLPASSDVPEALTFGDFREIFDKRYPSHAAEQRARAAYADNLAFVKRHNREQDQGLHTFRCGVNHMSDIPFDEWRKTHLGTIPSTPDSTKVPLVLKPILLGLVARRHHRPLCRIPHVRG